MSTMTQLVLTALLGTDLLSLFVAAQRAPAWPSTFSVIYAFGALTDPPPGEQESGAQTPRYPNAETERLEIYVGAWSVTERHYDARGEEIGVVKGGEDIVWVLDRHAIGRTYTTTHGEALYRATATIKWIPGDKLYRGVWFDNRPESAPTTVTAEWNAVEKTMLWKMDVQIPGGPREEYKIVEKFLDGDRREAVTYRVDKTGVTKTLVVQYKRTVPCPGRVRMFLGD